MLAVDISLLQEQAASVLADVAQGSLNQDIQDALEQTDLINKELRRVLQIGRHAARRPARCVATGRGLDLQP